MSGFQACRAFLGDLELHAMQKLRHGAVPPHAEECARCSQLLDAAAVQASWLARSMQPEVPAAVRSDAFLDAVHDRALAAVAAEDGHGQLETALRQTLQQPVSAPQDPDVGSAWEDGAGAELRDRLEAEPKSAPGWLWTRIRSEIRAGHGSRMARGRRRRFIQGGAILAAGLLFSLWFGTGRGTSPGPEIVIVELSRPPLLGFSPVGLLEEGR